MKDFKVPPRNSRWKKRLNACYAVSKFPYSHLIMPFLLLWKLTWFSLFTESCQRNNSLSFWSWVSAIESMSEFKLRKLAFSFVRNDCLAAYHFCIQVSLLPLLGPLHYSRSRDKKAWELPMHFWKLGKKKLQFQLWNKYNIKYFYKMNYKYRLRGYLNSCKPIIHWECSSKSNTCWMVICIRQKYQYMHRMANIPQHLLTLPPQLVCE